MKDWLPQILPHLWQSTIFGLIVVAVILALPKAPARIRYVVGWFGLAKFLLPLGIFTATAPALNILSDSELLAITGLRPLLLPEFVVYAHQPAARAVATAAVDPAINWVELSFGLWAAVTVLLMAGSLARSLWVSRRVLRAAVPFDADHANRLAELAGSLGVKPARVRGYFTASPTLLGVVGLFRSRILVPRDLVSSLARDEVDTVLLHELAHVRRRDNLWRLLQAGVVGLLWFHPVVWWLHRRLLWESERACDELVLSAQRNQRTYAGVLLKAARFALGLGMPGVSGMSRMRLQPRVQAILNHQARKDSVMKTTGLLLLLGGTFAICSVAAQTPALIAEPPLPEQEKQLFQEVKAALDDGSKLEALGILQDYLTNENAHSPAALFNVGNLYVDMGNMEQATAHYEAALAEYPHFKRALLRLHIVRAQQGNFAEAAKHGELYLAQFGDHDDPVVNGLLGLSYLNLKQPEKAIGYYKVAIEHDPNPDHLNDWKVGLVQAYLETEQWEEAIATGEDLLNTDTQKVDLLLVMANAALALKDEELARQYVARAQAISGVAMAADTPVESDQFDVAPVARWRPFPAYPKELKEKGIEGRVVVAFTITPKGAVADVSVESASEEAFKASVLERIPQWIYEPATKDGEPVNVRMKLPITFKLGTPSEDATEAVKTTDTAG